MMTRERFAETNWKMTYEEYQKCDCTECEREKCIHRDAYRRLPEIDGGLNLCPNLKEDDKQARENLFLIFMKRRSCDVTVWRKIKFRQKSLGRKKLANGEQRVWFECEVEDWASYNRPESQGGSWILAQKMKIIRELTVEEVGNILLDKAT